MADSRSDELPHLGTFVTAAELGSFTAAGSALGITQAAVSQRIAHLEREVRVSLFDRRAGRISLTESGRRLYACGRKILDMHDEARRAVGAPQPPVSGDLSLAASSVPGECLLPALLSAFRESFPYVHVRATVSDSGSVLTDIEKGRASVGLVGQRTENAHLDFRPIGSDRLVLVIPRGHPFADRRTLSLQALRRERLILREPGSGSRCVLVEGLERAGLALAAMNVTLELGSNAAIIDAVRRDLGVAFLSQMAVRRDFDAGELRTVTVRGLDLARSLYLVFHRGRPLAPAAMAFLQFLEAHPLESDRPSALP